MKKSQITIVVIVALIIILVGAVFFYTKSSLIKVKPPVQNLEVSDNVKPIQDFVVECLDSVSKQALIAAGNNGGFTNLTNVMVRPDHTSEVLIFEPQKIPYWYYLDDKCGQYGCVKTKKPPLCKDNEECVVVSNGKNSIQESMNKYVENNIDTCINDFESFKGIFDIKKGKKSVRSVIKDESISFILDYPLDITYRSTNEKINIPYFYTAHNVKLKEIYMLAQDIFQAELDTQFLETNTMNLITIYSGIDPEMLPPIAGLQFFTAQRVFWTRSKVKDLMINDVLPFIGLIRIMNTGDIYPINPRGTDADYIALEEGIYRSMMIKVSENNYYGLKANIIYPYSDIYLRIGDSEVIKPDSMDPGDNPVMKMFNVFLHDYSFKYDITYPVIVRISDPKAFNGEGYDFSIALETNIRQNVPVKGNITVINLGPSATIDLESEEQKVNRTITFKTHDKYTKKPLVDVIVYYRCGTQFVVGLTALPEDNEAMLVSRMPYCGAGGQIIFEKIGYMSNGIEYNNLEGIDGKTFEMELWPLQNKKINVMKRTTTNVQNIKSKGPGAILQFGKQVQNLSKNETVMLTLVRSKNFYLESDVPVLGFLAYTAKDSGPLVISKQQQKDQVMKLFNEGKITEEEKDGMIFDLDSLSVENVEIENDPENYLMDFAPGTYSLDAFMIYKGNMVIPAETRRFCPIPKILGICIGGEKEIKLDRQEFDTWINGGAKIEFTLSESQVYNGNEITFYVLEQPLPTTWDMLEEFQTIDQFQSGKTFLLKPLIE